MQTKNYCSVTCKEWGFCCLICNIKCECYFMFFYSVIEVLNFFEKNEKQKLNKMLNKIKYQQGVKVMT